MVVKEWIDIEPNLGRFLGIRKHCNDKITCLKFANYDVWYSYETLIMVTELKNNRKMLTEKHIHSNMTSKHAEYMCGQDRKTRLLLLENECYYLLKMN